MHCPKCNVEITNGAKFCSSCGYKLNNFVEEMKTEKVAIASQTKDNILRMVADVFSNKNRKKSLAIALVAIVALIIIGIISSNDFTNKTKNNSIDFEWSNIVLCNVIPEPDSTFGEIYYNDSQKLSLDLCDISYSDFQNYANACKSKGFNIEVSFLTNKFEAYNQDGFHISIYYDEDNKTMSVSLTAKRKFGELVWPTESFNVSLLPVPKSTKGSIEKDNATGFIAFVDGLNKDDFLAYTEECKTLGFNIDITEFEKSFSAKNKDGYKLKIDYQGNCIVRIEIIEPEYNITLNIECTENWFFSTYDIKIYVNDEYKANLQHGETDCLNLVLRKGTYTIRFENADDSNVIGTSSFDVVKDDEFKFGLYCTSSAINVTPSNNTKVTEQSTESTTDNNIVLPFSCWDLEEIHYSEAVKKLEDAGFTNVDSIGFEIENPAKNVKDGSVVVISLNGDAAWEKGMSVPKDSEIIVKYRIIEETTEEETTEEETTKKKNGKTVYTTPTGEKYHYSKSCAGKNAIDRDYYDVVDVYDPCKKCVR
ncbi:MAG: zinc ribbon domain-containing protein [Clostridia bacterium]|nr:zinc ribbon domain-containing protein [Clostridia bacterium]